MWFIRRTPRPLDTVRNCPICHGQFTYPMDWEPLGEQHWHLFMRCGGCDWRYDETIDNARAAQLDRELDGDQRAIRAGLEHMDRERMAAEIDAFVTALSRDLIDAADFAPR